MTDKHTPGDVDELITQLSRLAAYDPDCYDLYAVSAAALSNLRAENGNLRSALEAIIEGTRMVDPLGQPRAAHCCQIARAAIARAEGR